MLFAVVAFGLALPAIQPQHRRQLSTTNILTYSPGSQVTDHANIDLDQQAIESALGTYDYTTTMAIYTNGAHSKPAATCTLVTPSTLGLDVAKGTPVSFTTVHGDTITGKAAAAYVTDDTEVIFTYPVSELQVQPETTRCYVGGLPLLDQFTQGCIQVTSGIGTFTIGATTYTASCSNSGKRTLQGFSTKAEKYMYKCNPTPDEKATYPVGCPYTSYLPYYEYYGVFDYANQIVLAALEGTSTSGFTHGGMSFVGVEDTARKEVIKKGTAYMSAWMYAIREFEDAIDDCAVGDLTNNMLSSGSVHAWDEGVAFYTGSLMDQDDLLAGNLETLPSKGVMAYTLGNKRCQNFRTCDPSDGNPGVGEAAINIELFQLFRNGKYELSQGNCAALVPLKDRIVSRMTVPLIQGTLRYAYKMAALGGNAKAKAEGAIFAAAVLPQLHNCSAAAAALVYDEMNMNSDDTVDYNAVKAAFEGCYEKMDITCADVGGLWNDGVEPPAYFKVSVGGVVQDASPCGAPPPDPDEAWKKPAREAGWVPCPQKSSSRRRMTEEKAAWSQDDDDK